MPSLKEIAAEANVSVATVSNVLNGRTRAISPSVAKRAARIFQIAEKLNYKPHASARSMRSGRFGVAAMVTGAKYLSRGLFHSVHAALARHGMLLAFEEISKQEIRDPQVAPRFLREQCVDGLLIHQLIDIPADVRASIARLRLAAIWMNSNGPVDCVYPDEIAAAYALTSRLLAAGCQRIAFVNTLVDRAQALDGQGWHYSIGDRIAGYHAALRESGLKPMLCIPEHHLTPVESLRYLRELLGGAHRPDAIIAYEFAHAVEAFRAAADLRLQVPQDLVIGAFVGEDFRHPALPFVIAPLPWDEIGTRSVEMLMQKLAAPDEVLPSAAVPYGPLVDLRDSANHA